MTDNITLPREVVKEALEALEHAGQKHGGIYTLQITMLRTALAAPKQEPLAYFDLQKQVFYWARPTMIYAPTIVDAPPLPLYAAPPALAAPSLEVTADPRLTAEEAAAISAAIDARKKEQSEDIEALRRDAERWRHWRDSHGFAKIDHEGGRCFVTLVCDCADPDQAVAKRFAKEDSFEWLDEFTDAAMKENKR